MTVKDWIEQLSKCDPDAQVVLEMKCNGNGYGVKLEDTWIEETDRCQIASSAVVIIADLEQDHSYEWDEKELAENESNVSFNSLNYLK